MFILYDLIFILFCLIYLPIFIFKRKWHKGFFSRLGFLDDEYFKGLNILRPIWIHAVSVGEVKAIQPFLSKLRKIYPDKKFVLSTVTKTGNEIAQKIVKPQDVLIYLPLDLSFVVRKFLDCFNPCIFIIVETEIWPNIISQLKERNIPVAIINGRLSKKSLKGYRMLKVLFRRILNEVDLFCMQTKKDAENIIGLGAPKERVEICGNMKFDMADPQKLAEENLGKSRDELIFVAGSTHRGEEEVVVRIYKKLLRSFPELKLLIAPRHIERVPEIEKTIGGFGFSPVLFSEIKETASIFSQKNGCVIILDTLGQLNYIYRFAAICFIGGSLVDKGGHNIIEPALFSKPVIFGPFMSNFDDIAKVFIEKNAAVQVKDEKDFLQACVNLLSKPELRNELGGRARQIINSSKGSADRHIELITRLIR